MTKGFNQIPANVPVMLDANIVIYALFPQSSQHEPCKALLERGARGDIKYGLMVNDSIIVAVMKREKIHHLATNDADFERVQGIAVRNP